MRQLVYYVACSVDGFIARPDGGWDGFLTEGEHVEDYLASLGRFGAVLMGRKTYEVGLREGKTDPYPALESYVFSTTLGSSPDPRVTLVRADAAQRVRSLKAQSGGDVYLCGGAELASHLAAHGLLDELALKVHPFAMGAGIPLFAAGTASLRLSRLEHKPYASGVTLERFAVER